MSESSSSKIYNCFIMQLYKLVNEQNPQVCWIEGGSSFMITNNLDFEEKVLKKQFLMKKFVSFTRKLTKYGFSRNKKSRNSFVFHHKYFTSDGNSLAKIEKLNKEQLMPKHLKLKLLREQLSAKLPDQVKIEEFQLPRQTETSPSEKLSVEEAEQRQNLYQSLLMELLVGDE